MQRIRAKGIVAVLLLGAVVLGVGTAQGRKRKEKKLPAGLPEHISQLATQLYGLDVESAESITQQIQSLAVGHLVNWAANRSPSDVQMRREIEHIFSQLRYPAAANATTFEAAWKSEILLGAGYSLGWSPVWRTNVALLFASRDGHTRKVAFTTFVPQTDLHFLVLSPGASGAFRFLIYGWRQGKSNPRLTAVLYSFNGQNLQSSWKTRDLFDGKLSVQGNQMTISYLKEQQFIRATSQGHYPPRYQATYTITPKGIELASEKQIPFQ